MPSFLGTPSSETYTFAAGLEVPVRIDCAITDLRDVDDDAVSIDLDIAVELQHGRFVCTDLRVKQRPGGPAITGDLLRDVRVHEIVRDVVHVTLLKSDRGEDGLIFTTLADRMKAPEGSTKRGPTDETLRWVAQAYEVAHALNDPPTKSVQTALGVSRATAGRWVAQARERGLLAPVDEDGAGQ